MESYQLSLNQVNFEHYHLGEEAQSQEQLHSFSNLVCYDMDLKSEGSDGPPVKPKRVNLIKGENFNAKDSYNFLEICEEGGLEYFNESPNVASEKTFPAMSTPKDNHHRSSRSSIGSIASDDVVRRRSDSEISAEVPDTRSTNTFKAFTETVEAFALQKSVIGSTNIAPASMEEIEKAIAEAQAKLKGTSSRFLDERKANKKTLVDHESLALDTLSVKSSADGTSADDVVLRESTGRVEAGVETSRTPDILASVSPVTNQSKGGSEVVQSNRDSLNQQNLIRVSAERIETSSASRGSWLWGSSKSQQTGAGAKNPPAVGTKKNTRKTKSSRSIEVENGEAGISRKMKEIVKNGVDEADHIGDGSSSSSVGFLDDTDSISEHSINKLMDTNILSTVVPTDESLTTSDAPVSSLGSPESASEQRLGFPPDPYGSGTAPSGSVLKNAGLTTVSPYPVEQEGKADDESVVERLLREKAGLEGRLEVLEQENQEMLREHMELKARATAAEEEIKTTSAAELGFTNDRKVLAADIEMLKQNRSRLEAVIMDAHKLLEEKEQEVRALERDLELARQAGEKHLERVADGRKLLGNRDANIRDLKAKIAELYVESQTSHQSRQITEGELAAVMADVAALTEAKEWYVTQLRAAQKDRNRLQTEAAAAKAETIAASVTAERLRAENARIKRNLTEVEQRVLTEKQKLAHHLEEIEHDMLEREAAFAAQLKQTADIVDSQFHNEAADNGKDELDVLRSELKRVKELAESIRRENLELSRRVSLSQQSIVERDETIKSLEHDRETAEVRAETAERESYTRFETIRQLENERAELSAQLEASSEERKVIDQSLVNLKRSTGTLETSFRKMQQDLLAKTAEVERLTLTKNPERYQHLSRIPLDLNASMRQLLQIEPEKDEEDLKSTPGNTLSTADELVGTDQTAGVIQVEKYSVEVQTEYSASEIPSNEPAVGKQTCLSASVAGSESVDAAESGASAISGMAIDTHDLDFARLEIKRLELAYEEQHLKVKDLHDRLVSAEESVTQSQLEVNSLSEQLSEFHAFKVEAESDLKAATQQTEELDARLQEAIRERSRLEEYCEQNDRSALSVHSNAMTVAVAEQVALQTKLEELQRDSIKEISKLKAKILKLNKQLESSAADQIKQVMSYEVQIRELSSELALAAESKSKLESQIDEIRVQSSMDHDERVARLQVELQKAIKEIEADNATRVHLEEVLKQAEAERVLIEDQNKRYAKLETELQAAVCEQRQAAIKQCQAVIEERQAAVEQATSLALELEKERGRLAGLLQSHTALKAHIQSLESTLAQRVSTDVRADSAMRDEFDKNERALVEVRGHVEYLESELAKERQNLKDLRTQLRTEKGNHIKTRRQLEQLTAEHNQLVTESGEMREGLARLADSSESSVNRELELRMAAERAGAEMKAITAERDRLLREMEDQKNKDSALQDNVQGLEWRLSEKENEIAAFHQRLQLVEDRQTAELASISETLKLRVTELTGVRDELALVKKERSALQVKMIPLQVALKKALAMKVDLSMATETTAELERLLEDTVPTAVESKPLSFLQATLNGLRGEISSLQMQMTEHTSAVQSSSMAWRELEAQVQDLREVCQTSAADRAAASQRQTVPPPPFVKLPPSLSPRSTILRPSSGPLVLPGNLANVTTPGAQRGVESSRSVSPDSKSATDSRRSSRSSLVSDASNEVAH